jgi:hypothetical protein
VGVLDGVKLATCSYAKYKPEYGVAVRTSVGIRGVKHRPLPYCRTLTPWGIFRNKELDAEIAHLSEEERALHKQALYFEKLTGDEANLFARLHEISAEYSGQTLVLCCFEDVVKDGDMACHRRWAADWFGQQYGIEVPELTRREAAGASQLPL